MAQAARKIANKVTRHAAKSAGKSVKSALKGSSSSSRGREQSKGQERSQDSYAALEARAKAALKKMQQADPGLKETIQEAQGYAVFPSVGKAALVVGGAYGRGVVFERGKVIGYCTVGQLTVGVQIGGDTYSQVIVFEDEDALESFQQNRMKFAANASAVLVKAGAAATTNYEKGAKAFVFSEGGMLLELGLGGQKFTFKPADEQDDEEGGKSSSGKGKSSGARDQSGQGKSEEDEDDEQSDEEDDQGGAMGFVRQHPIWSTVIGAGLATGAMIAAARLMRSGSKDDEQDDDEDDDGAQDYNDEEGDEQDEGEDEGEEEGSSRNSRHSRF